MALQAVFNATSLVDLCQQHLATVPDTPTQRLGQPVSPELESALLACLEKSRAKRPQTARDLAALLDRAPSAESWSLEEADAWWGRHERSGAVLAAPAIGLVGKPTKDGDSPSTNGSGAVTASSGLEQTMALDQRKTSPR